MKYDDAYYQKAYGDYKYKKTYISFAKTIKRILNPKRVLDVGCGFGHTVRAFNGINIDAEGVEISKKACKKIDDSIKKKIFCVDILKFHPKKKYDLIIMDNLLEHVIEYEKLLKKCSSMLSKNGWLLAIIPFEKGTDPTHVTIKSRKEWIIVFRKLGFRDKTCIINREKNIFRFLPFEFFFRRVFYFILKDNLINRQISYKIYPKLALVNNLFLLKK